MMSFRSFVIFSLPLLLSALAWADEPSAAAPLQLQPLQLDEDFESGTLNQPPWSIQWLPADAANVAVQSDIVRAGKHAVRIVNRPEDEGRACERTELVNKHGGLKWGNEYWIGFSFYLKNWQTSRFGEMVHQFHAAAHKGDHTWRSGRNITSIFIEKGEMQLQVITKPHDGPARGPASAVPVWKASVESDVWQDWVIHVRPSPEENGLLEVWRNGQRLYVQQGRMSICWTRAGVLPGRVITSSAASITGHGNPGVTMCPTGKFIMTKCASVTWKPATPEATTAWPPETATARRSRGRINAISRKS